MEEGVLKDWMQCSNEPSVASLQFSRRRGTCSGESTRRGSWGQCAQVPVVPVVPVPQACRCAAANLASVKGTKVPDQVLSVDALSPIIVRNQGTTFVQATHIPSNIERLSFLLIKTIRIRRISRHHLTKPRLAHVLSRSAHIFLDQRPIRPSALLVVASPSQPLVGRLWSLFPQEALHPIECFDCFDCSTGLLRYGAPVPASDSHQSIRHASPTPRLIPASMQHSTKASPSSPPNVALACMRDESHSLAATSTLTRALPWFPSQVPRRQPTLHATVCSSRRQSVLQLPHSPTSPATLSVPSPHAVRLVASTHLNSAVPEITHQFYHTFILLDNFSKPFFCPSAPMSYGHSNVATPALLACPANHVLKPA